MRRILDFFERGTIAPLTLAASALIGLFAAIGFLVLPVVTEPVADMYIKPAHKTVMLGDTFTVEVTVSSRVPVNVFAGELRFNNNVLSVESISYNTSIADLWVEKPWYSNGDGTLNFGGGTTHEGGFSGADTLITVVFKARGEGEGVISIHDPRILLHDGLGTDATLGKPLDAIFTVGGQVEKNNLINQSSAGTPYKVIKQPPSTDLNGDGRQSIADISIFMLHMAGGGQRYDFNLDGNVNTKDLNILLGAR